MKALAPVPRNSRHFRPLLGAALAIAALGASADDALKQAIGGTHRTPAFVARDAVRKPYEELVFFGTRPDATVVEISPGGGYWTEILAPYLRDRGTFYVAQFPLESVKGRAGYERAHQAFLDKLAGDKPVYGRLTVTAFAKGYYDVAPPGSADFVLTFRNLHNWIAGGYADEALQAFHRALKPGGILGIEDHRAPTDRPQDPKAKDGYVREDYAIELAKRAGFEFVARSEILANPRDTKDYPQGVWTLPPTLSLKDTDRAKYVAIGEADNFALKFRKPLP
ncbi:MAG: class I SAM-dependent methyltransferase [Betaproteobacteria bacterium]|nr:class I SAM-dependent methyltransferase [Betaproteobacteria bacterium]